MKFEDILKPFGDEYVKLSYLIRDMLTQKTEKEIDIIIKACKYPQTDNCEWGVHGVKGIVLSEADYVLKCKQGFYVEG